MRNFLGLKLFGFLLFLSACDDPLPKERERQVAVVEAEFDIAYSVSGVSIIPGLTLFVDEKHDIVAYGVRDGGDSNNSAQTEEMVSCGGGSYSCSRIEGRPPIVSGRAAGRNVDSNYHVSDRIQVDGRSNCYAYTASDRADPATSTYSVTCEPYGVVFFSFKKGGMVINYSLQSYSGLFRGDSSNL